MRVQVYKALLNEVTEVAAKQLQASSEAQTSLFRREITIHKCCRSVSPPAWECFNFGCPMPDVLLLRGNMTLSLQLVASSQ